MNTKEKQIKLILPNGKEFEVHNIKLEVTREGRFHIIGKVLECDTNLCNKGEEVSLPIIFTLVTEAKKQSTQYILTAEYIGQAIISNDLMIQITDKRFQPKDPMHGNMYTMTKLSSYKDPEEKKSKYQVSNAKNPNLFFVAFAEIGTDITAGKTILLECVVD